MRYAPLIVLGLVSVSCGRGTPDEATPSTGTATVPALVGEWMLRSAATPRQLVLSLRVDSVGGGRVWGRLVAFMAGNAGMHAPDDWAPATGRLEGDQILVSIPGVRRGAPRIELGGAVAGDTVRLGLLTIGPDTLPGPWLLVRDLTASRP